MSTYHAPLTDIRFALHDVLQVESLFSTLGFDDANRETVDAVLDECALEGDADQGGAGLDE